MLPPGIKEKYDDNVPVRQAELIAYNQIRDCEEQSIHWDIAKALHGG